jgi:tRNA pseudouridine32 synthase/23S rRNA pseudouridine746 synthase
LNQEPHVPPPYLPPPTSAVEVIFSDAHMVAINKPSGLLSVPGIGPEKAFCAHSIVSERFEDAYVVHRLDMDTSGVMVFARSKAAQRSLSMSFEKRLTTKTYEALVEGIIAADEGTIDKSIAKFSLRRPLRHLDPDGQTAITHWRALKRCSATSKSRLELSPITGRSHQLRLHLKSIGHPILGDAFYGDPARHERLCLHAKNLSLPHPIDSTIVHLSCPVPF